MEQLGAAVRAGAPDATETIAYGMPALRLDGRFLVSWASFKAHYSLFPASDGVVDGAGCGGSAARRGQGHAAVRGGPAAARWT